MILSGKRKIIFSIVLIFLCSSIFGKTILSDDFTDFFPPEIFKNFPPSVQEFDSNAMFFNMEIYNFDKTVENDEVIEIKYAYFPKHLPKNSIENSVQYKYTSDYTMRFFRSENSIISIHVDPNQITTRVYKDDKYIRQCKYDDSSRLMNEIFWKVDSDETVRKIEYFYSDDEKVIPDSSIVKNFELKNLILNQYADNGQVSKKLTYKFSKENENVEESLSAIKFDRENLLVSQTWKYDEDNRVIESSYDKGNSKLLTKNDYSKNYPHPDEEVYENGIKKSVKNYSSESDYTYEIFLSNGFSIKSVYVQNLLDKEIFYRDGVFLRENKV
nr:hypothetical protein [Treponemataceae bacterium]